MSDETDAKAAQEQASLAALEAEKKKLPRVVETSCELWDFAFWRFW